MKRNIQDVLQAANVHAGDYEDDTGVLTVMESPYERCEGPAARCPCLSSAAHSVSCLAVELTI